MIEAIIAIIIFSICGVMFYHYFEYLLSRLVKVKKPRSFKNA